MNGEFTNYCRQYYDLMCRVQENEAHFNTLVEHALPYTGQTCVAELDAIIRCNRRIQKARATADDSLAAMHETAEIIAQIMAYFEIPPETPLTCEVPGLYELILWADADNQVYCIKTEDFAPLVADPDIITIDFTDSKNSWEEDEGD